MRKPRAGVTIYGGVSGIGRQFSEVGMQVQEDGWDNESVCRFLTENLQKEFINREYSLHGTASRLASNGKPYGCYVTRLYGIPRHHDELLESLKDCIDIVERVVTALFVVAQHDQEEGEPFDADPGRVRLEWRIGPSVSIGDEGFDRNPFMQIRFRVIAYKV